MPKITRIVQQAKQRDRYSIFVDDKYSFSLSENALLASKLASGQELTQQQVDDYKQLSAEDKLFNRALRYVAMRPRTVWEMQTYLERKGSPAPQTAQITNKLIDLALLDDEKYALAFVRDRALLRPTSVRKMIAELRKRRVPEEVIQLTVQGESTDEQTALRAVIAKAKRQAKYRNDEQKLMQYLARQGFNYGDIKAAIDQDSDY
jgi:regulatory protein